MVALSHWPKEREDSYDAKTIEAARAKSKLRCVGGRPELDKNRSCIRVLLEAKIQLTESLVEPLLLQCPRAKSEVPDCEIWKD